MKQVFNIRGCMKRFFIETFTYYGVISTNDMFKLISTVDNIIGDCYEIPAKTSLRDCMNNFINIESKLVYSSNDPYCDVDKSEYGFKIESSEYDEDNEPIGDILYVDLKTSKKMQLDYSNTFSLKGF